MSTEAADAAPQSVEPAAFIERDRGEKNLALRCAFGACLAFAVSEALNWAPTFLAPVLVIQVLASVPRCPSFAEGVGVVGAIVVSTGVALLISTALTPYPDLYVIAIALVLFVAFYLNAAGKSAFVVLLLLISITVIPAIAVQSMEVASDFAHEFVRAGMLTILVVWLMHAAFPAPLRAAESVPATPDDGTSPTSTTSLGRTALINTLVVLPVELAFLLFDITSAVVILVTVVTIVRQHTLAHRSALGLLVGNVMGGIAATVMYNLLVAAPSFVLMVLMVLAAGLGFGSRIAYGGPRAPLFMVAFITTLILLGAGLSPFQESGEAFYSRLVNVLIAVLYTVSALALTEHLRPSPATLGAERDRAPDAVADVTTLRDDG